MPWQPATTAPTDGTQIWICYADGHRGANVLFSAANLRDAMLSGMIAWCDWTADAKEPPAPYAGMAWS